MHRLPFADNGNINAGWSAIPHCSRIAMHLKAPLSRATRLKKGEEDESTPCRSRAARCKNEFAQVCILLFFFCVISNSFIRSSVIRFRRYQEDDSMDGFWNCIAILKILIKLLCLKI